MVTSRRVARQSHRADRSRTRQRIGWCLLAILVIVVAAATWVGARAYLAKQELDQALPLATTIQTALLDGDSNAAVLSAGRLQDHSAQAAALTSDPIWRVAEALPWLGANLAAVRQLAGVVDSVSQGVVGPLAEIAGVVDLDSFKPVDGVIDVQPMVAAQPQLRDAVAVLSTAVAQTRDINTSETLEVVQNATQNLDATLATTLVSVEALNRAAQLLPAMLGSDGPRNYVLMFQNPAELRSSGGITGALALLHTENGQVSLVQQESTGSMPQYDSPVVQLDADTRNLYGDITGRYIQDVNLTPDFRQSGVLVAEMWRLAFGTAVDGVISLDPVALSYLLEATGPITLPSGDVISSDNAVKLLLSDVYARFERSADQDAFFASAAASVFSAVAGGEADATKLAKALARAGDEHRVLVYSASEGEQALLADTTLAGGLPTSTPLEKNFGIYLNEAGGTKMDTYLDMALAVGQVSCRNDKRPEYGIEVVLTNTAPADAAASLSRYVTGGGMFGVSPGNIKTLISAYGSPELQNLGVTRDGVKAPYLPATDAGYQVSGITVELAPGESTVLRFGWLGAGPFVGSLSIQATPTVGLPAVEILKETC